MPVHRKREYIVPDYNVFAIIRRPDRGPVDDDEAEALARHRGKHGVVAQKKLPSGILSACVNHNVLVNQGRHWLRNLAIPRGFPPDGPSGPLANEDLAAYSVLPSPVDPSPVTYRTRFVAIGTGGYKQNWVGTPNPTPAGTFTEVVSRTGLERPHTVRGTDPSSTACWMRQHVPFTNMNDRNLAPDAYTARIRAVFDYGDVSYVGSHDYEGRNDYTDGGRVVPISEAAVLSSMADPFVAPWEDGVTPVNGLLTYDTFVIQPKTVDVTFEILWDLLF